MRIVISTQEFSYRTESGEWLDGDRRELSERSESVIELDADDIECRGDGDAVKAAVSYISETSATEASSYPVQGAAHEWLSGTYENPYTGDVTETTVRVEDCTEAERAEIFRAVGTRNRL